MPSLCMPYTWISRCMNICLCPLFVTKTSKLEVFGHDSNPLVLDGTKIDVDFGYQRGNQLLN